MQDDEIRNRISSMLESFYESLRFSAPEMIPIHLEALGGSIEGLVQEVKDER